MRIFIGLVLFLALVSTSNAGNFYVTTGGGGDLANNFDAETGKVNFAVEPDYGYMASLAFGTKIEAVPGLKVEIEASWRHGGVDGLLTICKDTDPLTGTDGTFATLLNVIYSHDLGVVRPYAKVGAGFGARRIVLEPTPENWGINSSGANEYGFAWGVGAGIEYEVSKNVLVGIGYDYFVGPAMDRIAVYGGEYAFFEADADHHVLKATVTFEFD